MPPLRSDLCCAPQVKFQKLQIAYDVLKDADKRRLYDRGQLVE
jgi:curved DNA-binding protein CbpA